jgi:NhaP-type Na+/H+ or K+/H+ antiporter
MTRDSVVWWVGMIGGVAGGLAASFDLFPWFPPPVQHAISLIAFVVGIVSGKLATSPLPHSKEMS